MHKGYVAPRYSREWYDRHNSSCLQKGTAFGVATFVGTFPFMFLFHGRRFFSGGSVRFLETMKKSVMDAGAASVSVGAFLGSYCALNNWVGSASVITAMASVGIGSGLLGLQNPKSIPLLSLGGMVVGGTIWYGTWFMQSLA